MKYDKGIKMIGEGYIQNYTKFSKLNYVVSTTE